MIEQVHTYGEPCFQNNSCRTIKVVVCSTNWLCYYATSYVQGMVDGWCESEEEGLEKAQEALIDSFNQYKKKLNREDKLLFKSYFDSL